MDEPITSDEVRRQWAEEALAWVRDTLGIDLARPIADNDWTLVVKLHAMIEAALNSALITQFGAPELEKIIAKLDTSNPATGKVAFAKALDIISHDCAVFLQQLSELRNFCVHDIRNFDFDLDKYANRVGQKKSRVLNNAIARVVEPGIKVPLQTGLLAGAISLFMDLHFHRLKCKYRDLKQENDRLKAELFDKLQQSTPSPE